MPETRDDDWERSHLYVLFYDEIDSCGCGWNDDAYELVRDLLDHFAEHSERNVVEMIGSTGAAQLVLRRLDAAGLADHGTSIRTCWLTEKGRYVRHLMHRHTHRDLDATGYPDCYDHDEGACPDECWIPPADVPPLPPWPTTEELMERVRREADDARAAMDPIQRAMYDETAARMESMMLFGTPEPPEIVGEVGPLMRGVDVQAEADQIRARIDAARRAGTVDLLRQLSPKTAEDVWAAAKATGHTDAPSMQLARDWFGEPVSLISVRGCRQIDGTWVHTGWRRNGHTCPKWVRG